MTTENADKQAEGSPTIREAIFRMADINRNLLDRFAACVLDVDLEAIAAMTVENIADGFDAALSEDDDKYLKRIVEVSTLMRNGPKTSAANKPSNEQEPRIYDLSKYQDLRLEFKFIGDDETNHYFGFKMQRQEGKGIVFKLTASEDAFEQSFKYELEGIWLEGVAKLSDMIIVKPGERYNVLFTDQENRERFMFQIDDWANPHCESIGTFTAFDEGENEVTSVRFHKVIPEQWGDDSRLAPIGEIISTLDHWFDGSMVPSNWREQLTAIADEFKQENEPENTPREPVVIPAEKLDVFTDVLLTILDEARDNDKVSTNAHDLLVEAIDELANDLMPLGNKDSVMRIVEAFRPKGGASNEK